MYGSNALIVCYIHVYMYMMYITFCKCLVPISYPEMSGQKVTRGLRITEYSRIPSHTNVWLSCIPRTPDFSQDLKFENVSTLHLL